jgi:hypothetical protein
LLEIQVRFPNRYFKPRRLGRVLGKMACLNWKSDALATVIRPLPKGTGHPPKRHLRGNTFEKPNREIRFGFLFLLSRHPSDAEIPA